MWLLGELDKKSWVMLEASNPKVQGILNNNLVFIYHHSFSEGVTDNLDNTCLKCLIVDECDNLDTEVAFKSGFELLEVIVFIKFIEGIILIFLIFDLTGIRSLLSQLFDVSSFVFISV